MRKNWIAWMLFAVYAASYFAINVLGVDRQYSVLLLIVFSFVVSLYLLVKNGFSSKKGIVISGLLTVIYVVSKTYSMNLFVVFQSVNVFLSSVVSCKVMEMYPSKSLRWLKSTKRSQVIVSVLIGLVTGVIWGVINIFLMKSSGNPVNRGSVIKSFIESLNPAVFEEVTCRTLFGALVLSLNKGFLSTKFSKFTCWFMMIVPHVIPHMVFSLENGLIIGIVEWIVILLLYVLVFGILFTALQKKRDITSAMVAHGVVDFIRFVIFSA